MTPPGPPDLRPERVFRLAPRGLDGPGRGVVVARRPLGHDEAAYAIGGADLAGALPSPRLYRSVGMHLMWNSGCASADQGPHPRDLARSPLVYGVWFDGVAGTPGPEDFVVDPGVPFLAARVARQPGRFEILRLTPPPPRAPGITRARPR